MNVDIKSIRYNVTSKRNGNYDNDDHENNNAYI